MSANRPVRDTAQRAAEYASHWSQPLWRGLKHQGKRAWGVRTAFRSAADLRELISESRGYIAAFAGVAVVSLLIALLETQVHIRNISLLYLLVVLWLAAVYGRVPAIVASVSGLPRLRLPVHLACACVYRERSRRVVVADRIAGYLARAWAAHRRRAGPRA